MKARTRALIADGADIAEALAMPRNQFPECSAYRRAEDWLEDTYGNTQPDVCDLRQYILQKLRQIDGEM
jgi:hypothetical protein